MNWKAIVCFFRGHDCEPTGRHALMIRELLCLYCGGLFVQHAHHGNALIRQNATGRKIMNDCHEAEIKFRTNPARDGGQR